MNNGPYQNGKMLAERLAGSSSAAEKAALRGLHYFEMTFPFLQVLEKYFPSPLPLSHTQWRVLRMTE